MKNHRFPWLRNRTTDNRKCEKARNIKEKRTIEMFKAVLLPHMCDPHGLYRRKAICHRGVQETFFRLRCSRWTDTLKRANTFLRICI